MHIACLQTPPSRERVGSGDEAITRFVSKRHPSISQSARPVAAMVVANTLMIDVAIPHYPPLLLS